MDKTVGPQQTLVKHTTFHNRAMLGVTTILLGIACVHVQKKLRISYALDKKNNLGLTKFLGFHTFLIYIAMAV